jgi:hypothetical protein
MTAELVHLTVVPNAYEAEMLCALLRTEGLTCDLRPTNLGVGMMDGLPGGGPKEIVVAEQISPELRNPGCISQRLILPRRPRW